MKLKYLWVGFFVPALAVFSLIAQDAAAQCPESEPPRRATTGPYQYVRDRLVTDSLTPNDTQNKARESSISGDNSLSVGYETIHSTANAVYLQRFNTNGTRRCLGQFGIWDEPYIRLDNSNTPGQHRHVSVAQRHLTIFSSSHDCVKTPVVFACWQATATQGTLPDLMQFTQPFLIQIAGDFRQTIFNSNPGRVVIPNLNRNDVAPSAAVSCHTSGTGFFWESALSIIRDIRDSHRFTSTIMVLTCITLSRPFQPMTLPSGKEPRFVTTGDVDGNGLPDILEVGGTEVADSHLRVIFSNCGGM